MDNHLPCEDFYSPIKLKTLKELLFDEEDQALKDYLDYLPSNTEIFRVYSNNILEYIEIKYNI